MKATTKNEAASPFKSRTPKLVGGGLLLGLTVALLPEFLESAHMLRDAKLVFENNTKVVVVDVLNGHLKRPPEDMETQLDNINSTTISSSNGTVNNMSLIATVFLEPPRIFICGYGFIRKIAKALFPQESSQFLAQWDSPSVQETTPPTELDILVFGLHGPCKNKTEEFPGRVLIVNGESRGDLRSAEHMQYQIGGLPYSDHSVRVYFVTMCALTMNKENNIYPKLLDPAKRPQYSGKYQAIAYISRNCVGFRERAMVRLNHLVLPVHIGGECIGGGAKPPAKAMTMSTPPNSSGWEHVVKTYHDYKFCLVMENRATPYYITEKILTAFLAGCIPIYYGTTEVFELFNPQAFVFLDARISNNREPIEKEIQKVSHIAHNATAYRAMMKQPILAHGEQTLRDYFSILDDVGGGYLKQKIRAMLGLVDG